MHGRLSSKYPSLSSLLNERKSNFGKKLLHLLNYFTEYGQANNNQDISYEDGIEMMGATLTLASKYGGSETTWYKYLKSYCTLGLLNKSKPKINPEQEYKNTPAKQRSADRAKKRYANAKKALEDFGSNKPASKSNPVTWYSVPEYTPALLEIADNKASFIKKHGKNPSKDAIRDAYGTAEANRITDTYYDEPTWVTRRRQAFDEALRFLINTNGYTTSMQVIGMAFRQLDAYQHSLERVTQTWKEYRPDLLESYNLQESRPSKAEKIKYNLSNDKHIIRYR